MAAARPPRAIKSHPSKAKIVFCMYESKPSGCLNPNCTFVHQRPRDHLPPPQFLLGSAPPLVRFNHPPSPPPAQQSGPSSVENHLPGQPVVFNSSRVCRFESTPTGCTNKNCAFQHTKPKSVILIACRFEQTPNGCKKQDCPFQHINSKSSDEQSSSLAVVGSQQQNMPSGVDISLQDGKTTENFAVSEAQKSYWQLHGNKALKQLCNKNHVAFDFGSPNAIRLHGKKEHLKIVQDGLKKFSLIEKEMKIEKLGFSTFLREDSGKAWFEKLQLSTDAYLMVKERTFQVDLSSNLGLKVSVVKGNIVSEKRRAVVIPCDASGNPVGSVSEKIVDAIQLNSTILAKAQKVLLNNGSCISSVKVSSAQAPWKVAILATFGTSHHELREGIQEVLKFANNQELKSIVIPNPFSRSVESSDKEWNQKIVRSMVWYIVGWLLEFQKGQMQIQEVILCDLKVQVCDLWKSCLVDAINESSVQLLEIQKKKERQKQQRGYQGKTRERRGRFMESSSSPPVLSSLTNIPAPTSGEMWKVGNISVDFVVGDIFNPPHICDVMVNSVGASYNLLGAGELSKKVASIGGAKVVAEFQKRNPINNIAFNRGYVITTGGNLPYQKILHVQNSTEKTDWQNRLLAGLNHLTWTSPPIQSLAIPALGSGGCGIPSGDMAKVLKLVLESLLRSSSLRKCVFILQDAHTMKVYQECFQSLQTSTSSSSLGSVAASVPLQILSLNEDLGKSKGTKQDTVIGFNEEIKLNLVADSASKIDAAEKKLKVMAAEICKSKTVDCEMVASFGSAEVSELNKLCFKFEVNLKLDVSKKQLFLEGKRVAETLIELHGLMSAWQKEFTDLKGTGIQWLYQDPINGWTPYSDIIAGQLEKEYQKGAASLIFDSSQEQGGLKGALRYTVDFVTWKEIAVDKGQKIQQVPVKRKSPQDKIPAHWNSSNDFTGVLEVPVSNATELNEVKKRIAAEMPQVQIISVERIENVALYKQYLAQKEVVEKEVPSGYTVERTLYHGTKEDNISKINKEGWNRSFAGMNVGKAYGAGNYFAKDFTMSYSRYATPNSAGLRKIYQAKVLTGYYAQGRSSMLTAPDRPDGKGKYHSTVDNTTSPSVFVTYPDAHAYPEYVITVR